MKNSILTVLMLLPAVLGATEYSLKDEGDFAPAGQRVEFADRFGWEKYKIKFDFSLDSSGRSLSKDSKLSLLVTKRDGKTWDYTCKAKGKNPLGANVNFIHGKGISVVAECRIAEDDFAKAVGLDKDDVGAPNLVFQAIVQDGAVQPGAQRGLYFLPSAQIESSDLNVYAAHGSDPSDLAVVFRSN